MAHLLRLQKSRPPDHRLDYDDVIRRSELARSFVEHPYWEIVSRMLSGTIQSETEEMLTSDERLPVNRASVAICRKVLQMPFFDMEQGKFAESALELSKARSANRSFTKARISAEGKGNGKAEGY